MAYIFLQSIRGSFILTVSPVQGSLEWRQDSDKVGFIWGARCFRLHHVTTQSLRGLVGLVGLGHW